MTVGEILVVCVISMIVGAVSGYVFAGLPSGPSDGLELPVSSLTCENFTVIPWWDGRLTITVHR